MFGSKLATKLAIVFAIAAIVSLPALSHSAAPKSAPAAGHIHTMAAPAARVIAKVDNSKRTTLSGHLPGALHRATDLGHLAASTPAEHLVLVLKSSDEQKAELHRVLDEQQDSRSANYHQWVTPEEFGTYFGAHDDDIAKVSAWLESQGFTVEDVSKSKRVLHFSGTTGQIEKAFHTEMHSYTVNGESHVSNNSEITVPSALSPVIGGVSLHNFFRKSHMGPVRHLKDSTQNPFYTGSSTVHYVGPWDFAKIYNTFPLLNAGITGAGSSIAVVGRSDILMSDVQTYRQMFGLPNNDPIFIHAGPDNGTQPGDDGESDLDVEISGGIAQDATVYFVIGTPTFLVDGISNSIQYIVENNLADIISISYGSCESTEGEGGNAFNSQIFEQAAAQGMSVFVAAGDNGPAECDNQNNTYENQGYATGSESSTPYTVSVGGTGLAESLTTSVPSSILTTSTTGPKFWNTTSPLTGTYPGLSAISYIPETPWNSSASADYSADPTAGLSGLWSGSGGISSYYIQPSWQRGSGVPTTDPPYTYGGYWVTDVTITNGGSGYTAAPTVTFAANGSGTCLTYPSATATISGGSVTGVTFNYATSTGTLQAGQGFGCSTSVAPKVTFSAPTSGTTATGTPTIGPMVNTPPLVTGVPHRYTPDLVLNADDGNDATLYCSEGVCEYNTSTGALEDAGLVGGTSVAAPSMAGIQALINQANGGRQGAPNYIYYALSAAQTESACNSSLGASVGSTCAFHDITLGDNLICGKSTCTKGTYTSSGPTVAGSTKMGWLAGTGYDLATGLGSVNAYNLSSQWKNVVFNSTSTALSLSQTTGIQQGDSITLSGAVAPGSGSGTPTGDVAFILSQGEFGQTINLDTGSLNGSGTGAYATLNGGNYSATVSNLPGGTYTVTARYGGDQTYASSLSAPVTVTVAPGNSQVTITPEWFNDTVTCTLSYVNSYNYGQFAWIPAAVTATSGSGVPTGTVTFTVDGNAYATETLDAQGNAYLAAGTVSTSSCLYGYMFAQSPTLTGGTHVLGASYLGDSSFNAATATPVTITVNPIGETGTITASSLDITPGASVQLTATFTTTALTGISTQQSGPTGTVTFTDSTTSAVLGTATVIPTVSFSGNTYTFGSHAALTTTGLVTTGVHAVNASYTGDSNFLSAATTSPLNITVGTTIATTTTVTSSSNPTTLNGRPTLTATITAASGTAPTSGTVSFYDNYTGSLVLLGSGTVGTAHTATYKPASGAAFWGGAHPITAVFAGTATNTGSTSAVFTQNVTLGTATIILDGKLQGAVGQSLTFAAVLTPSSSIAAYAPNQGVATFYDGSNVIGTSTPITVTSTQGGYGLWTATIATSSLTAGTHTITAKYNDINYSVATSNALTVVVDPAQSISWAAPAPITYPAALTATQLDAVDTVPGVYTYSPALGTVLLPGTQKLSVTFTPTNTANYTVQTTTVQLQVNQAPQAINFTQPTPVTYGAVPVALVATGGASGNPVTFSVLSGPGSVSGVNNATLRFTGAGTVLVAANQASSTNYTAAPQVTRSITVNPATLTVTAINTSRAVGAANPTFTASYSGFVNGDTSAVVGGSPSLTTTATASSAAGLYPITPAAGTLTAANYTFSFVNGTLSVVAAPAVSLTPTATLRGTHSDGYTLTVTFYNPGTTAVSNLVLTSATLGTTSGSPLPQAGGTVAAGGTATFTVAFPGSVGADGAGVAEKYSGTYSGGSFSISLRSVTLP